MEPSTQSITWNWKPLEELRDKAAFSQLEVAAGTIARENISRLEHGRISGSVKTLVRFWRFYVQLFPEVSFHSLLTVLVDNQPFTPPSSPFTIPVTPPPDASILPGVPGCYWNSASLRREIAHQGFPCTAVTFAQYIHRHPTTLSRLEGSRPRKAPDQPSRHAVVWPDMETLCTVYVVCQQLLRRPISIHDVLIVTPEE